MLVVLTALNCVLTYVVLALMGTPTGEAIQATVAKAFSDAGTW